MENQSILKKKYNVAFICFSNALGGLELSTLRLASLFKTRINDVILITLPNSLIEQQAKIYEICTIGFKPKWKYPDIFSSLKLSHLLKQKGINFVIILQSKDIGHLVLANLFYRKMKLIFYQQMQSVVNKKDFYHTWIYSKLSSWLTLTDIMRNDVIAHTKMDKNKIKTVLLGINTEKFQPSLYNKTISLQKFNIPNDKFIIGMIGRLDPLKGQTEFIQSIPLLLQHHTNLHFVIAGDETIGQKGYKKYLTDLSNSLGVNDYLQFISFTESVPELLAAFDIFVLPSHSETYGLVTIEAMSMEKAIIATNAGGVPEILKDQHTALLIPPKNYLALAEAIMQLLKNEEQRMFISANARIEALKRFDINQTVEKIIQVIDTL